MKRKSVKKSLIFVVSLALIIGIIGAVIWGGKSNSASSNVDSFVLLSDGFTDRIVTDPASALAAIGDVADVVGIDDINAELTGCKEDTVSGNTYYRFQQVYQGIPVYGQGVVIIVDAEGNCLSLSSNISDTPNIPISEPSIDQKAIEDSVAKYVTHNYDLRNDKIFVEQIDSEALTIYFSDGKATLAYFVNVRFNSCNNVGYYEFVVDANTGKILYCTPVLYEATGYLASDTNKENGFEVFQADDGYFLWNLSNNLFVLNLNGQPSQESLADSRGKILYDENGESYTITHWGEGTFVLSENEVFGDTDNEVRDNYETGAKLLKNVDSIVNYFGELGFRNNTKIFLYYQDGFDGGNNALGGFIQDDIGVISMGTNTGVDSIDVIAHEFTHFVSRSIVHWSGNNQTGSINEALSDIFGEIVEGYIVNQEPNWKMSNFRDIESPDGNCITNYSDYDESLDCHYASTLLSHASYLMYNGISNSNQNFEALTANDIAHLFYETLYILPSDCSFSQFRTLVQNTAEIMYCQGRLSYKQVLCVSNAFFQVGITPAISSVAKHLSLDVYGIDGLPYENYTLSVRHYGGAEKTYSGETIKSEGGISSPTIGNYELCIVDNANTDNKTSFTVRVVENGGATKIPVFTQCGLAKPNGPIESEINQSSEIDIPVSLLSHDPFNDHKMQFGLTEYEVSGGIRETDGNYNTYMDLPDFPAIVSMTDDFGHDGDILQLTIGGKEYKNDKYLAIDFSSEDRKGHHYLLRLGDWAGESVYCYISRGANTDYLVMEKLSPTSSAVGSETFYIGRANGCFQEEIWIISLNDFSDVKYTLNYEREYEAFTIREEASDLEWGRYLCCQDGVNFIYNNDSLYDSYDKAMEHIKERLSKYGLEDRVSLDKTNDSQSANITPLFLEHQNGIQRDVALASVSDLTLNDIMIFGVNPELSSGNSLVTEPEESTSLPDSSSLLGTWDSNDGEMRLILNSTGSDMAFTKDGIKNASGSITIIDLKKGEKHLGAYIIGSNTITIVLDLNEYEMYYSFDNSTLIIGEKELHRMDNALISQLIGTWEGDGLKIYFSKDNDVTLYEKSRTRHGLYAVLSESEVLINVDGYAVNASNYSVNGTTLNFNGAVLYKDGVDTSYATISSFADKVIGDWKACNDETGSYYVFTADGNYEYYSMEGIFHPTLSGCYEIVSENELHLVYDQYSYSVLTLESDDILEDSGGRKYTKVK